MVTNKAEGRLVAAANVVAKKQRYKIIGRKTPQRAVSLQLAPAKVTGSRSPPPKLIAKQ
jgi:hypothetical protein